MEDTLDSNVSVDPRGGNEGSRAINEKIKTGEVPYDLSFLLYSIYGHDSYPGYLKARFAENRPEKHEKQLLALQSSLAGLQKDVASALESVRERSTILSKYAPLHPHLAELTLEDILVSETLDCLASKDFSPVLREECDDVFSLPVLKPEICTMLLEESKHFLEWQAGQENDCLQSRLCVMDHLGPAGSHITDLVFEVQKRLAPLYSTITGDLDYRYAYIIGYGDLSEATNRNIVRSGFIAHSDDSEITMNICLRPPEEYEGGELTMRHLRHSPQDGELQKKIKLELGRAVLHLGQQVHEVEAVTRGERQVLIVWARSARFRGSHCPCCRMHRRTDLHCVLDPRRH